jgi:hypothetical protein
MQMARDSTTTLMHEHRSLKLEGTGYGKFAIWRRATSRLSKIYHVMLDIVLFHKYTMVKHKK